MSALSQHLGRISCNDNLALMASLPDACCDLIYADPPFCTGRAQVRNGAVRRKRCDGTACGTKPVARDGAKQRKCEREQSPVALLDSWPGGVKGYLEFLAPRIREMRRLLSPTGTLYLHLDWHAVHYVKVLADDVFGADNFLNEVIWSYRTGGRSNAWFARKHDTILVYARRLGCHKFHLLRGGAFRTDGMNYDSDGRPYKKTRSGRLYFHPDGPALTDVWEIPFLSTVSLERTGYPTQKPEALLERIIRASTDPDDLVADFFCGSGTTLAVARRLGRRWLGCDSSPQAAKVAQRRLSS